MGGDAVLFDMACRGMRGTVVESNTATYGKNRQTYRDVVFEDGADRSVVLGLPQSALQHALGDLETRVRDLNLAPAL
jgi:hypothetical protein